MFENDTTLGIVRHFSTAFARRIAQGEPARIDTPLLAADFERELGRNLATLFGRV